MQLATLAKSVASIQVESSRRRRYPYYDEDESSNDDAPRAALFILFVRLYSFSLCGFIHSLCAALFILFVRLYSFSLCGFIHSLCAALFILFVRLYSFSLCGFIHSLCAALFILFVRLYSFSLCGFIHSLCAALFILFVRLCINHLCVRVSSKPSTPPFNRHNSLLINCARSVLVTMPQDLKFPYPCFDSLQLRKGGMPSMIGLPSDHALVEDDECLRKQ
uniref:Uncharacterized protein LOC113784140 n=1 Tax=Cicer arietinum TaxID=3827 RepID=A0A3Q7YAY5_CICAR|nr:uncharacterized protein LOC113784140 [Cicer arietinum]